MRRAGARLQIMAGGGINERNVHRVIAATGVTAVHATLRTCMESSMVYRSTRCSMGGALRPPEFGTYVTSSERVAALLERIRTNSPADRG